MAFAADQGGLSFAAGVAVGWVCGSARVGGGGGVVMVVAVVAMVAGGGGGGGLVAALAAGKVCVVVPRSARILLFPSALTAARRTRGLGLGTGVGHSGLGFELLGERREWKGVGMEEGGGWRGAGLEGRWKWYGMVGGKGRECVWVKSGYL